MVAASRDTMKSCRQFCPRTVAEMTVAAARDVASCFRASSAAVNSLACRRRRGGAALAVYAIREAANSLAGCRPRATAAIRVAASA